MSQTKTTPSVFHQLLGFTVPLILTGLLQQLYSITDSLILGNFVGQSALTAVGSASSLLNVFLFVITGLVTGCTIMVSHAYGAGDYRTIGRIAVTFSAFLTIGGIIAGVIGALSNRSLLLLLNTPVEFLQDAVIYLTIMMVGMPFLVFYNLSSAMVRGIGDSKTPLYALLITSVVNISLNLIFVIGFHAGIAGSAWSTVLSQMLSAFFLLLAMRKMLNNFQFRPSLAAIDLPIFREGIRLSLPRVLLSFFSSGGSMLLQNVSNGLGYDAVTAVTTAYKIDSLIVLPATNIATAVTIFTGQSLGAADRKRAEEGLRKGLQIVLLYTVVAAVLLITIGSRVLGLFGISDQIVALGQRFFLLCAIFYPIMGIKEVLLSYLQGCKDVTFVSFCAILALFVRVGLSYLLVDRLGFDVIAVAEMASWVFAACFAYWRYRIVRRRSIDKV